MPHPTARKSRDNKDLDGGDDPRRRQTALLKSLEYLYIETCQAKLTLAATLVGAAVEAIKDELAGRDGSDGSEEDFIED